jgi:F-type H+-transporting ATPase subunit b
MGTLAVSPLIEVIPGLMIWTLVCFLITFLVLKKFAFGPIQRIIDERRRHIRASLEEAERTRTEARGLLEEHRALRAKVRGEAEEILAEARRVADAMAARARSETEDDRRRRLEDTKSQIAAETERALEQIRAEVAELALVAAEKVTRRSLDHGDQRRLIDDAVRELDFSALERQP